MDIIPAAITVLALFWFRRETRMTDHLILPFKIQLSAHWKDPSGAMFPLSLLKNATMAYNNCNRGKRT